MSNKTSYIMDDALITLKQYDVATQTYYETNELYCNSTKYIYCLINYSLPKDLHISLLKIKFSVSNTTTTSFCVIPVYNNTFINSDFQEEAGLSDCIIGYEQCIDITKFLCENDSTSIALMIKPANDNSYFTTTNNASLIVEGIEDKYYIKKRSIVTKNIGYTTTCYIDTLFSKYKTVTNLFTSDGGELPLNLNLVYSLDSNINTSVCPNFKFNYEQYVIRENDYYKYIDGDFVVHYFLPSNIPNHYYDVTSPGSKLFVQDITGQSTYEISDGYNKVLSFNTYGQLTKIRIRKSDTVFIENNIEYNNNNKISRVYDDTGRSCSFTYYGATISSPKMIVISKQDLKDIVLIFEDNYVKTIAGVINNSQPNNLIHFDYINLYQGKVLRTIKDPSREVIEFSYDEKDKLNSINHYVEQGENKYPISNNVFSTFRKKTIIYNYMYGDTSPTKSYIEYSENGNVVNTYDVIDDKITNNKSFSDDLYEHRDSILLGQTICEFSFNHQPYNYVSLDYSITPNYDSNRLIDFTTQFDRDYQIYKLSFLICFNQIFDNSNSSQNKLFFQFIKVKNNNEELLYNYEIPIENYNDQLIEKDVFIPKDDDFSLFCRFKLVGIAFSAIISNITFKKYYRFGTYDCSNQLSGGNVHSTNNGNWYQLCKPLYIEYNDDADSILNKRILDCDMTKNDYLMTLNSYYFKRSTEGRFTLWYNDGCNCLFNVKDVRISLFTNTSFLIQNIIIGTVDETHNKASVELIEYGSSTYAIHNDVTTYGYDHSFTTTRTYDKYGNIENILDSKHKYICYTNTFGPTYTTIKKTTETLNPGNEGLTQKLLEYNLYEYTNDNIINTLSYASTPELFETPLISNITVVDKVSRRVSKNILPNDHQINYLYEKDNSSISKICTEIDNVELANNFNYTNNLLSTLSHNNSTIELTYGTRNEIQNIKVGNENYVSMNYSYNSKYTNVNTIYNTGYSNNKTYDLYGRLTSIKENGNTVFYNLYSTKNVNEESFYDPSTEYLAESLLRQSFDGNSTTYYYYDCTDYNNDDPIINNKENGYKAITKIKNTYYTKKFGYDDERRIKTLINEVDNLESKLTLTYINGDTYNLDLIEEANVQVGDFDYTKRNEFDKLQRIKTKSYGPPTSEQIHKHYSYYTGNFDTSNMVKEISYEYGYTPFFTEQIYYNSLGNISEIKYMNNHFVKYSYDLIGRLVREENSKLNRIFTFDYDSNGNIIEKKEYELSEMNSLGNLIRTVNYVYDNIYKDKLTSIINNNVLKNIEYTSLLPYTIGNDILYWGKQNNLLRYESNNTTINYNYNCFGVRLSKVINKPNNDVEEHIYIYDGSNILKEIINKTKNNNVTSQSLDFVYDDEDVIGFIYNRELFYYVKDTLGNVIEIFNEILQPVCKYEYDAWGNHKVYKYNSDMWVENFDESFIGNINPIRYKGYYYDVETQLFYCNSRYYSPELCRWISPDSIEYLDPESINGLNLYCYCANNPIMYVDPSGHAFIAALLISMGIAALIGGATAGYSAYQSGERGWDLVADIAGGAIFGAAVGATIALGGAAGLAATGASVAGFGLSTGAALGISVGATAVAGMAKYSLDCVASNENNWNFGGFVLSGVEGALQGAATFGLAFVGGKSGLFNKLGNFRTADAFYINHGGMNTLRAVFWGSKVLIGETLSKALLVSGSAALARWLIDLMIPDLY